MSKPKTRQPSQSDILRLGPEVAAIKASIPPKRWRKFVKMAHKRGFTVGGQLSNAPDALKERTNVSLRKQAEKTMAAAYKPVTAELSRRERAQGHLEAKRAADDAAYNMWLTGESDKLTAQAAAADAALATQQSDIATDLANAQSAGRADSIRRMSEAAGNVSDPGQSTALAGVEAAHDTSAKQVAASREHTAAVQGIGDDADKIARAALIATAAVRQATTTAENWKARSEITADRRQSTLERKADTKTMIQELRQGEIGKAQTREELALASGELGIKRADIAADIKEAARQYGLDKKRLHLDEWKALNADAVDRARVQLGYDQIVERRGKAAADRELDKWLAKYREKNANARNNADNKGDRKGVTQDERDIYKDVDTARTLILRKLRNGKTEAQARQELINQGVSNVMFDVANDLRVNGGRLSPNGARKAKRIGISHVGYFWDLLSGPPSP
jgi:hypothetical protein